MDVERVFSSRLRLQIIKLVDRMGELNVSEIARRVGVNYGSACKHLKVLEDEGILRRKEYGRIHLYRLNELSPKTKAVQHLISTWEEAESKEKE